MHELFKICAFVLHCAFRELCVIGKDESVVALEIARSKSR